MNCCTGNTTVRATSDSRSLTCSAPYVRGGIGMSGWPVLRYELKAKPERKEAKNKNYSLRPELRFARLQRCQMRVTDWLFLAVGNPASLDYAEYLACTTLSATFCSYIWRCCLS